MFSHFGFNLIGTSGAARALSSDAVGSLDSESNLLDVALADFQDSGESEDRGEE